MLPNPQRETSDSKTPPGGAGLLILILAALLALAYWQRGALPTSDDRPLTDYDAQSDGRGFVSCWTAVDCAALMAASWQDDLPLDLDAKVLEEVTASGVTLTFVQRLKYDRAYHDVAEYPDGKTWEQFQSEFAETACDEYDHRPLVSLGGRVVHRTLFSNGELLDELIIDACPPG